jgi:hypothetical protein
MGLFSRGKNSKPQEQMGKKKLADLAKRIEGMVEASDKHNRVWMDMYYDALHYIYGDQFHNITLKKGWEKCETNYILPALMQTLAFVSQQQIKLYANPWEENDKVGAEAVQGYLQYEFEKQLDIPRSRLQWVIDGFAYGAWAAMVVWNDKPRGGWDAETHDWLGEPEVVLLRPGEYGVDPNWTKETLDGAQFALTRRHISIDEAKDRWPGNDIEIESIAQEQRDQSSRDGHVKGIKITGAANLDTTDGGAVDQKERDVGSSSSAGRLARLLYKNEDNRYVRRDGRADLPATVELVEIWFNDNETQMVEESWPKSVEELDAEGITEVRDGMRVFADTGEELTIDNWPQETDEYEAPKYPNGRHVMMIGDLILNPDDDEQAWEYKEWPLVIGRFKILPHTWHGMNGVEVIRGLQDFVNISSVHILNNLKNFGDPGRIVEEHALANVKKTEDIPDYIAARAGRVIVVKDGRMNGVKTEWPQGVSGGALETHQLYTQEIRNQTGIHEIVQGIQSKGQMTASEALRLETNSRLGIALLLGNIDSFTTRLMYRVLELSAARMQPGRMLRVIGDKGHEGLQEFVSGQFDVQFDLTMIIGTALPFDKERKRQEALQLYEILGPPYLPDLLDAWEVPDADKLLQKNEAWTMIQNMLAEQEAMAEQGGEGGMPPPEQMADANMMAGTGIPKGAGGFRPPESPEEI